MMSVVLDDVNVLHYFEISWHYSYMLRLLFYFITAATVMARFTAHK